MNRFSVWFGRVTAAAMIAGASVVPVSTLWAAPVPPADDRVPVRLTASDVAASNEKVGAAYSALVEMWSGEFRELGREFAAPRLVRYRGTPVATRCGVIPASNASYCLLDNTVYFDDVFVASQAKLAGRALRTDGDMTAVGIIAHEMGHAVAMQLGFRSRASYDNESVADCLAGAFARHSEESGLLEEGDIDEAFFGLAAAADPIFQPTGNARVDNQLAARVARAAHGTREQRTGNFQKGLVGGGAACLSQLRSAA